MSQINIPRIVIAGTHSGVGKTTIVTGILAVLKEKGLTIQSYKVGPDYIDPGYHQLASGKVAHNLDTWLVPTDKLVPIFAKTASDNDIVIIEGVMGLYDGGRTGISSTAAIAKILKTPVVLVIDARSVGESAAAIALGYKMYDQEVNLVGVIINRLGSQTHKSMICDALDRIGIPVLGCIYRNDALHMPERHLGLTPVTEHNASDRISELREQISSQLDINKLLEIAQSSPSLCSLEEVTNNSKKIPLNLRIGVAQDDAFSFYYPESLDVLKSLGAEIIPFSPISDNELPQVDGLLFGGGFPEMFANELAVNVSMRQSIKQACQEGMPVYAECGGFMYLTKKIVDFEGQKYDMVGAIPATCSMQSKLQTVGYVEATALTENILCDNGDILRGHEFHFSQMIIDENQKDFPWAFEFKKTRTGEVYNGGYASKNVVASYLHMHFAGNEKNALRFLSSCKLFKQKRK
ncbi:cobyrinate a,c-diamide synthase [Pelosinus sp. IPA-1]|uniref:cobyrinate a,c-diamide synthase n=1 Tax=Pelosinus sp. IPA-1 TaxID=3029569 RepID=UPI0024361B92|nr:cobyrinate a,c-diamide synthase [Pelosinus sp. IPA-1]GMA99416.1 cobyrinate a,c-diamide synthase [Pelosinus sp. IPA-1]